MQGKLGLLPGGALHIVERFNDDARDDFLVHYPVDLRDGFDIRATHLH